MLALTHHPSSLLAHCELTHVCRQHIDVDLAIAQHQDYRKALSEAGLDVRVYQHNLQYADSVFVEDVAVVLDELILLGSMGAKSRELETRVWRSILAEFRPVQELPAGATLEGGDVLRIGRNLVIGHSRRTNAVAIEAVSDIVRPLGYSLHTVPMSRCLHLKTACTALDDDTLLINPDWIDVPTACRKRILFAADAWGANVVRLRDRLLANSQHQATIEQLRLSGYQVEAVDLSEFAKAEAGATCLSLLI
ncbi:MAG: arginine deiminase family protein [Pirellula sp.]